MQSTPYTPGIRQTVNALFAENLAARPDDIFVDMEGEMTRFRDFDATVDAYARGLAAMGVGEGDTVCSLADNSMDSLYLWFAVNRAGGIWVPLNSALKGEFLRHQIEDSRARLMIADPHYLERIALVADGLETLRRIMVRGEGPFAAIGRIGVEPLANLPRDGSEPFAGPEVDPADPSLIIYTSGTTGVSKGCLCSHNYVCNYGREQGWAMGLVPGDVLWIALPLFHLGGLGTGVIAALTYGARIAIARQFSVSGFWPEIERSGATVTAGVGATASLIIAAPDNEVSERCRGQLRTWCAAPLSPKEQRAAKERFGLINVGPPGYGLTEASMVTLGRIGDPSPEGTSGRRFADFTVRITDDDGNECAPGVPGKILIKENYPQAMFDGYWHNPEATANATHGDWFNTGDIGKIDEEGFFTFVDRAKDYLRRRGENISSFEVETSFRNHPAIGDVAVHAVKSDVSEDDLKATIVLKEGASASERDICEWSVDMLPYYAVPRYVEFRSELPRNPVGRVLKYQLRDEGVTPATWDRMDHPDIVVRK